MKNSAVKKMISAQYLVDESDINVEFLYCVDDMYTFDITFNDLSERKIMVEIRSMLYVDISLL